MLLCMLRNQRTAIALLITRGLNVTHTPPPKFLHRNFTIHKNDQNNF